VITTQRGYVTLGKGEDACFDIAQASCMSQESHAWSKRRSHVDVRQTAVAQPELS
jgi:hypothetical protein